MFEGWKFEDKRPEENIIIKVKRHPIVLLQGIIPMFLIFVIIIGLIAYFKFTTLTIAVFLIGLICIVLIAYYNLFLWYNDVYILTDQRLIDVDQHGLFTRRISETSLDQIQEVQVIVNGPLETIFGFGQVIVQTSGPSENFILEITPKPYKIQQSINKAYYEYRKKIGIDKQKVEKDCDE
jgi:membrane protein YdbS with pleckstrin-like domain